MIRIIIILFLLTSSPVLADCKYYAEADVVNDKLINKNEHNTSKEKDNFFVQILTDPKYETSLIMIVATLLENL